MGGPSVAIVGSGFSGLGLAIALRRAGCTRLSVFERGGDVGGVWRDNTYPGAACDAPSHLYSYSFEPKHDWSRRFAPQPEILDYLRGCARKYGVMEHMRSGAEITDAAFDAQAGHWTLRTAGGETHVDTIIMGTGFHSHGFVAPMRVTGLDGRALDDAWRDGPRAYLGLTVAGFPNFFLMYGPNTNVGSGSVVHMLESQIAYIVQAVRALHDPEVLYMDVREGVLSEFDERLQRRLGRTVWNAGGCTSWYLRGGRRNASNWPGSMLDYRRRTRRLDSSDYRFVKR